MTKRERALNAMMKAQTLWAMDRKAEAKNLYEKTIRSLLPPLKPKKVKK